LDNEDAQTELELTIKCGKAGTAGTVETARKVGTVETARTVVTDETGKTVVRVETARAVITVVTLGMKKHNLSRQMEKQSCLAFVFNSKLDSLAMQRNK
jgi:hypothetical protein